VAAELVRWPELLAQLLFTPLLAGWSIWVGIAISTRFGEVRVAQQLGALASFPSVLVTALIAYSVIPASLGLAIGGRCCCCSSSASAGRSRRPRSSGNASSPAPGDRRLTHADG